MLNDNFSIRRLLNFFIYDNSNSIEALRGNANSLKSVEWQFVILACCRFLKSKTQVETGSYKNPKHSEHTVFIRRKSKSCYDLSVLSP